MQNRAEAFRANIVHTLVVLSVFSGLAVSAAYVRTLNEDDVCTLAKSLEDASGLHKALYADSITKTDPQDPRV